VLKSGCKKKTKQRVDVKQVAGSKEAPRALKRPVRFKVPANRRRRRLIHHRHLNRCGVDGGGDDGSRGKTCA